MRLMKLATMAALMLLTVTACKQGPFKDTLVFSDLEIDYCPVPDKQHDDFQNVTIDGGKVIIETTDHRKIKCAIITESSYEEIRDDNAAYLWHLVLKPEDASQHFKQMNIIMSKDSVFEISLIEEITDDLDSYVNDNPDFVMFNLYNCKMSGKIDRKVFAQHPTDEDFNNISDEGEYDEDYYDGDEEDYEAPGFVSALHNIDTEKDLGKGIHAYRALCKDIDEDGFLEVLVECDNGYYALYSPMPMPTTNDEQEPWDFELLFSTSTNDADITLAYSHITVNETIDNTTYRYSYKIEDSELATIFCKTTDAQGNEKYSMGKSKDNMQPCSADNVTEHINMTGINVKADTTDDDWYFPWA